MMEERWRVLAFRKDKTVKAEVMCGSPDGAERNYWTFMRLYRDCLIEIQVRRAGQARFRPIAPGATEDP